MVTGQLADCQLEDWMTRELDISRTAQLADATGDFACLVFFFGHLRMFSWVCTYTHITLVIRLAVIYMST